MTGQWREWGAYKKPTSPEGILPPDGASRPQAPPKLCFYGDRISHTVHLVVDCPGRNDSLVSERRAMSLLEGDVYIPWESRLFQSEVLMEIRLLDQ